MSMKITSPEINKQTVSKQLELHVGKGSMKLCRLRSVPPWLVQNALDAEVHSAWKDAFFKNSEDFNPLNANAISPHIIIKMKAD